MSLDLITQWVDQAIDQTPVLDVHTHLYPPSFGAFNLWGVDDHFTNHTLIADTIRANDVS
jgi:hypothetical protein